MKWRFRSSWGEPREWGKEGTQAQMLPWRMLMDLLHHHSPGMAYAWQGLSSKSAAGTCIVRWTGGSPVKPLEGSMKLALQGRANSAWVRPSSLVLWTSL